MTLAPGRSGKLWAVLWTAFLLFSSCAGKRLSPTEERLARVENELASLEGARLRLQATVDSLSKLVAVQTRELREGRAGGDERVRRLEVTLQALQSEVEALRQDLADLRDRARFEGAAAPGGNGPSEGSPRALYDAAYQDLAQGKHALALMGFQEVLNRFPSSELADNSQYWIGEAYYDQKEYEKALDEFRKVEQQYPTGDKVPASLLKIALTQQQLGKTQDARRTFESLVERFPSTEEARLARSKLQEL